MNGIRQIYFCLLFMVVTLTALTANASGQKSASDNNGNNDSFSVQQYGMSFDQIRQAAMEGDPDAEYALGYMYYYGKGTTRDEQVARMWIQKAAAQGQPQATTALKLLAQTLPPRTASNTADQATMPSQSRTNSSVTASTTPKEVAAGPGAEQQMAAQPSMQTSASVQPNLVETRITNQPAAQPTAETSGKPIRGLSQASLLKAPSHYYTVQLLGSFRESDITNFVRQHHLSGKATYYRTAFHDKPWYVLVYGIFKSDTAAQAAIRGMPSDLRKLNPWVKTVGAVQQAMETSTKAVPPVADASDAQAPA